MNIGSDVDDLLQEARSRWLKPAEVLHILQNYERLKITDQTPQMPIGGSLFLYNKRVNRYFRKDGHNWRKKRDGRSVGEAHERLKVNNVEVLNCYYAHGEENRNFQRRSYWMLDGPNDHIVLVHYREVTEGVNNCSIPSQGTSSLSNMQSQSSPVEVTSSIVADRQGKNIDGNEMFSTSPKAEVSQVLRRIEEQLSLDDDSFNDLDHFDNQRHDIDGTTLFGYDHCATLQHQYNGGESSTISSSNDLATWKEIDSLLFPQDNENFILPAYSPEIANADTNISDHHSMQLASGQFQKSFEADSGLIVAREQKFKIKEIVPDWGFANEGTKVVIIGSFDCNASETSLVCIFDDIEVPVEIIQNGVLCCHAPPKSPGKANVRINCGNEEKCSENIHFEYRDKHCTHSRPQQDEYGSKEELLILVQFVQMLLSSTSVRKEDGNEFNFDPSKIHIGCEGSLDKYIQTLTGSETLSGTIDWVLQELLKEKFQQWVREKFLEIDYSFKCPLSKEEQRILHLVAGLGYKWALNPILDSGVGVNFRDKNGCTALHWAACFGREDMVAALIASGAMPGAETDPTADEPVGKTPASIAAERGHKGIAGYLSEVSLTSHLSSLKLEEVELSKHDAKVEADVLNLSNILKDSVISGEDESSMNQTLAAVRNAAQAAARIQSAFRAHSFRKRRQKEGNTFVDSGVDEYGFTSNEIQDISGASKLIFSHLHEKNSAALSIQKNYKCWKGRNDFLTMRQKAVKIQAHIRGYQVRKKYKVICWAVGILDKVVLRWRRKGNGLRGFKPEVDSVDEDEDEDYENMLKVFRKQKVDETINKAVSRVLSMIRSPEAQQQYARMLDKFQEAKAQLDIFTDEEEWTLRPDAIPMEDNDDIFQFP